MGSVFTSNYVIHPFFYFYFIFIFSSILLLLVAFSTHKILNNPPYSLVTNMNDIINKTEPYPRLINFIDKKS